MTKWIKHSERSRYLVKSILVGFNLPNLRTGGKGWHPENKGKNWPQVEVSPPLQQERTREGGSTSTFINFIANKLWISCSRGNTICWHFQGEQRREGQECGQFEMVRMENWWVNQVKKHGAWAVLSAPWRVVTAKSRDNHQCMTWCCACSPQLSSPATEEKARWGSIGFRWELCFLTKVCVRNHLGNIWKPSLVCIHSFPGSITW